MAERNRIIESELEKALDEFKQSGEIKFHLNLSNSVELGTFLGSSSAFVYRLNKRNRSNGNIEPTDMVIKIAKGIHKDPNNPTPLDDEYKVSDKTVNRMQAIATCMARSNSSKTENLVRLWGVQTMPVKGNEELFYLVSTEKYYRPLSDFLKTHNCESPRDRAKIISEIGIDISNGASNLYSLGVVARDTFEDDDLGPFIHRDINVDNVFYEDDHYYLGDYDTVRLQYGNLGNTDRATGIANNKHVFQVPSCTLKYDKSSNQWNHGDSWAKSLSPQRDVFAIGALMYAVYNALDRQDKANYIAVTHAGINKYIDDVCSATDNPELQFRDGLDSELGKIIKNALMPISYEDYIEAKNIKWSYHGIRPYKDTRELFDELKAYKTKDKNYLLVVKKLAEIEGFESISNSVSLNSEELYLDCFQKAKASAFTDVRNSLTNTRKCLELMVGYLLAHFDIDLFQNVQSRKPIDQSQRLIDQINLLFTNHYELKDITRKFHNIRMKTNPGAHTHGVWNAMSGVEALIELYTVSIDVARKLGKDISDCPSMESKDLFPPIGTVVDSLFAYTFTNNHTILQDIQGDLKLVSASDERACLWGVGKKNNDTGIVTIHLLDAKTKLNKNDYVYCVLSTDVDLLNDLKAKGSFLRNDSNISNNSDFEIIGPYKYAMPQNNRVGSNAISSSVDDEALRDAMEEIRCYEDSIGQTYVTLTNLNNDLASIKTEKEQLDVACDALTEEKDKLNGNLTKANEKISRLSEELSETIREKIQLNGELTQKKKEADDLLSKLEQTKAELSRKDSECEAKIAEVKKECRAQLEAAQESSEKSAKEKEKMKQQRDEARASAKEAEAKKSEAEERTKTAEKEKNASERRAETAEQELEAYKSEHTEKCVKWKNRIYSMKQAIRMGLTEDTRGVEYVWVAERDSGLIIRP